LHTQPANPHDNKGHWFALQIDCLLAGVDAMVLMLRQRKLWKEQDVDLKGLVIRSPNLVEANMTLLHRFLYLDSFCAVERSRPFMKDPAIIETMVLKELQVLPTGFRTFFPFQCDLSRWLDCCVTSREELRNEKGSMRQPLASHPLLDLARSGDATIINGGYAVLTNKYWVFFECGPRVWTGRDVRGGPKHMLHAWKVPGDLWNGTTGEQVEQVVPGEPILFHPGKGKEKLKNAFRGWSHEEHNFFLKDHHFVRGIFAETQGASLP